MFVVHWCVSFHSVFALSPFSPSITAKGAKYWSLIVTWKRLSRCESKWIWHWKILSLFVTLTCSISIEFVQYLNGTEWNEMIQIEPFDYFTTVHLNTLQTIFFSLLTDARFSEQLFSWLMMIHVGGDSKMVCSIFACLDIRYIYSSHAIIT